MRPNARLGVVWPVDSNLRQRRTSGIWRQRGFGRWRVLCGVRLVLKQHAELRGKILGASLTMAHSLVRRRRSRQRRRMSRRELLCESFGKRRKGSCSAWSKRTVNAGSVGAHGRYFVTRVGDVICVAARVAGVICAGAGM